MIVYCILSCNDDDDIIGDRRTNVKDFLVDHEVCHEDQIIIHGRTIMMKVMIIVIVQVYILFLLSLHFKT